MKCPKCKGTRKIEGKPRMAGDAVISINVTDCPVCDGIGYVFRRDGIDYNRKIAVPEHKAGQGG